MKKIISILLSLISVFCIAFTFIGCVNNDDEADGLVWSNDNAVYAYVKAGFENNILKDVEGAFDTLHFQKVYVTEKNTNRWTPLELLFVLDKDTNEQEFAELLEQDERINHTVICRDLPFETVDTLRIEKDKDTIAVGEELELTVKGFRNYYRQPFDFGGLFVKPAEDKEYTVRDFKGINLKSVKTENNGWLYLELAEENYFNVIKAADTLSRLATIETVEFDKSNVVTVIPPIWEVSDETIVSFVNNDYGTAIVKGLKHGKVTVSFDGVSCEIVVGIPITEEGIARIETRISFGEVLIYYNPVRTFDFSIGTVTDTVSMDDRQIEFLLYRYNEEPAFYPDYKTAEEYESYLRTYYNSTEQVSSFTREQADSFEKAIASLGVNNWDEEYHNFNQTCGSWYYITIIYANGTQKQTRFYYDYPENYEAVENAFIEYLGAGIYCTK